MAARFDIRALHDAPLAIPTLAELLCATWPDWYGPGGPGDAKADLVARASGHGLPSGWVALGSGDPVGTIACAKTSFGSSGESPWAVGLCVAPRWRGQGIGAALIGALTAHIDGPVYTAAREAAPLFRRLGWVDVRPAAEGWVVLRTA